MRSEAQHCRTGSAASGLLKPRTPAESRHTA